MRSLAKISLSNFRHLTYFGFGARWNPDAIVFDSWRSYGTPSYWMQHMMRHSNNATWLNSSFLQQGIEAKLVEVSTIVFRDAVKGVEVLAIKVSRY